ncbi:MAG: amidophosphoribosyltransferase [Desulfobacteraceae bacterium]|nr:amidophosphoribosyltransferase [Desulfobacteraceae bacterium]
MGGVFGTASRGECVKDVFYGTDYHSHLGTKRGGMAFWSGSRFIRTIHSIESDYFRSKFEPDLPKFSGNLGIGVISDNDSQPLIIGSHLGNFAIVTVAKINNLEELARDAYQNRRHFSESTGGATNPTELIAMLICDAGTFEDGIRNAQEKIKGSCSILLMTEKGIFAARDKLGRTPLIVGKRDDGFAVASESCSFPNLEYAYERDVGPGEILFITPDGCEQRHAPHDRMQVCSFLWVYYGYPASNYEDINVESVRYQCGACLAKNDDAQPDFVAGIPDSGIGHALGYAQEKHVPYQRPYVKYTPTWPRSFMPQNQKMRDLVANMKLIPVRSLIRDKSILFCDDSIVRGTQLKDNVQLLFEGGAREIHMRIACPTLIYPCEFLNFSTSRSTLDLAGRRAITEIEGVEEPDTAVMAEYATAGTDRNTRMVEKIRKDLFLTSLKYQKMDDLVSAIGLPKERLCTHCWDGTSYF